MAELIWSGNAKDTWPEDRNLNELVLTSTAQPKAVLATCPVNTHSDQLFANLAYNRNGLLLIFKSFWGCLRNRKPIL